MSKTYLNLGLFVQYTVSVVTGKNCSPYTCRQTGAVVDVGQCSLRAC